MAPLVSRNQPPIGESSSNVPSFPSSDVLAPQPPSHSRPRILPKVTSWGDEDVEAIQGNHGPPKEISESDLGGANDKVSPPGDSGIEETGESGANFGGPIGAPPPGFSEAFGLNGASVPLEETTTVKEETTTVEEPIFTTRKPK